MLTIRALDIRKHERLDRVTQSNFRRWDVLLETVCRGLLETVWGEGERRGEERGEGDGVEGGWEGEGRGAGTVGEGMGGLGWWGRGGWGGERGGR